MSTSATVIESAAAVRAPAVSVVVSTFGREHLLFSCIQSIIEQHSADWELLVVDQDASQRVRKALQEKFPGEDRIRYFNIPNAGLSPARNLGLQEAAGDVVAFLDDDTVAAPDWLSGVLAVFDHYPEAGMVAGRIRPKLEQEIPAWFPEAKRYLLGLYDIGDRLRPMPPGDLPVGANMAVRKDIARKLGGFDVDFGFNYFRRRPKLAGEDSMLALRTVDAGYKLFYSPQATVWHKIGTSKLTRDHFLRRHFWEGVTTIEILTVRGETTATPWAQARYHMGEIAMALARFLLPNYEKRYDMPASRIRMLALSRVAYSSGVIYGALFPSVTGQ